CSLLRAATLIVKIRCLWHFGRALFPTPLWLCRRGARDRMTQEIWPYWGVREPVSAGTHFPAFVCSIYATLLLWRLCRGDRARQRAMACYGLTMILQFGASTLYHALPGSPAKVHYLRLLDQRAIFALIAGTY